MKYRLKIKLAENRTPYTRSIRLVVAMLDKDKKNKIFGELTIYQEPLTQDDRKSVPYNIRYKGQIHSSTAVVNENNEVTFENPEFAELINNIESQPGVEMVMRESGIIDYYDDNDFKARPALKSIFEKVDASRVVEFREGLELQSRGSAPDLRCQFPVSKTLSRLVHQRIGMTAHHA